MIKERIEQAKKLLPIVNLLFELVEYNGCYNPKRYSHYLPTKKIEQAKIEL